MKFLNRKNIAHIIFIASFITFVLSGSLPVYANEQVKKMTKEELKTILGKSNLTILDARRAKDWSSSEFKIQGAYRADPVKLPSWTEAYPKDDTIVIYCA